MVTAIIVAAGKSLRMGRDKLFEPLCGIPILAHSIAAFEACPEIDAIVLVGHPDHLARFDALVSRHRFGKVKSIIPGGADRHLSVWAGLQAADPASDFIAIHDGARPLTTPAMIAACLRLAEESGAACCAIPISDTVKRADDAGVVTESVERANLWAMQTPQIFRTGLILHAYQKLLDSRIAVTDEVSAIQGIGHPIRLLPTGDWNFKITLPKDLAMAEQVLASRRRAEPASRPKRAAKSNPSTSRKPATRRSRPPGATG